MKLQLPIQLMFTLFLFGNTATAQPEITHFTQPAGSNASTEKMIRDDAARWRGTPIARFAVFDIAYPANGREFNEIRGTALLLVSAVAHDSIELPLKRVYVRAGGMEAQLRPLSSYQTEDSADKQVVDTFGRFRFTGLYVVPFEIQSAAAGELYADFASKRDAFKLGKMPSDIELPKDADIVSARQSYDNVYAASPALLAMAKREFPSMPLPPVRPQQAEKNVATTSGGTDWTAGKVRLGMTLAEFRAVCADPQSQFKAALTVNKPTEVVYFAQNTLLYGRPCATRFNFSSRSSKGPVRLAGTESMLSTDEALKAVTSRIEAKYGKGSDAPVGLYWNSKLGQGLGLLILVEKNMHVSFITGKD